MCSCMHLQYICIIDSSRFAEFAPNEAEHLEKFADLLWNANCLASQIEDLPVWGAVSPCWTHVSQWRGIWPNLWRDMSKIV